MEKSEHYIYMVIDTLSCKIKYIGKGKGRRSFNILSGTSNNYKANQAYHRGLTNNCVVYRVFQDLPDDFASFIEKALIYTMQPEWNSDHIGIPPDVDYEYYMLGWRLDTFIDLLRKGMWRETSDRFDLFPAVAHMLWCKSSNEVVEYLRTSDVRADKNFYESVFNIWYVCQDVAKEKAEYHF